MPQC